MQILKSITRSFLFFLTLTAMVGCGAGEADYTFDDVVKSTNASNLLQGDLTFVTSNTLYIGKNKQKVTTVQVNTLKNQLITYSIAGGKDAALFTINPQNGELHFIGVPEVKDYEVIIGVVTRSNELSTLQLIVHVVANINTIPPIVEDIATRVEATPTQDVIIHIKARAAKEEDDVQYTLVGSDADKFNIDQNGRLTFKMPLPDYGSNPHQTFDIQVKITSGTGQTITSDVIRIDLVGNRDEIRPVLISESFHVSENSRGNIQIKTVSEGNGIVNKYILSGSDADYFTINHSGLLTFKTPKDYEQDKLNYILSVQAKDTLGNKSDTISITIKVSDIDEKYTFVTVSDKTPLAGTFDVVTVIATSNVLTDVTRRFRLGNYLEKFTINDAGKVTFNSAAVVGTQYDLEVIAESYVTGTNDIINGSKSSITFNITVAKNAAKIKPVISAGFPVSIEITAPVLSTDAIMTISASIDPDSNASTLMYSIDNTSKTIFSIGVTDGVLRFKDDLDVTDVERESFLVTVTVKDEYDNSASTGINTILVQQNPTTYRPIINKTTYRTDENKVISINLEADARGNGTIDYFEFVDGIDEDKFDLKGKVLTRKVTPDFESKSRYTITVHAVNSRGYMSDDINLTINVEDINEHLTFTSVPQFTAIESSTEFSAEISATAVDSKSDIKQNDITYSINVDNTIFDIEASSGVLTFKSGVVPTYDSTVSTNNNYTVTVTAESKKHNGSSSQSPLVTVRVQLDKIIWDVDKSVFDETGLVPLAEMSSKNINVIAKLINKPTMTYNIECDVNDVCNVDANTPIFSIDQASGLMHITAPSYIYSATPEDNIYRATVFAEADDAHSTSGYIQGAMYVKKPIEHSKPTFQSDSTFEIDENSKVIGTVKATLPTVVHSTLKYTKDGGADAALFKINEFTGELSFWNTEDYENPQDSDHNNVYDVRIRVQDVKTQNTLNTATQQVQVTVNDVDESISFVRITDFSVTKGSTVTKALSARSAAGYTITYGVRSGYDSEIYASIDNTTDTLIVKGVKYIFYVLFFNPNFHTFTIMATDPFGNTATQTIEVRVRS